MKEKKYLHYEVLTNQILGVIVGWLVVFFIYPVLLTLGPATMATLSTVIFFIISYLRMYLVRMYFNKKQHERNENGRI